MSKVCFKFKIGERVIITALEKCEGIIEMQRNCYVGIDYFVAYWNDGKRLTDWLREDELEIKQ